MDMNVLSHDFEQKRDIVNLLSIKDLPLQTPLNEFENSSKLSIETIYRQYDFKFGCNFKGHENLELLAFAKPLIQHYIDLLINELSRSNTNNPATQTNIEALVDGFTLMYINRLSRVADKILDAELQIAAQNGELSGESEADWLRSFAFKTQNRAYVDLLNKEYPELFPSLVQVSRNWVAFVREFSERMQ